jgi:enamine deaminase RidA (YjgF/YER057c/UK114 family)
MTVPIGVEGGRDVAKIEPYAAKDVYDPPTYPQAVKVSEARTILYIAGQVAYTEEGGVAHPGDFKAQARAALRRMKARVEAEAARRCCPAFGYLGIDGRPPCRQA